MYFLYSKNNESIVFAGKDSHIEMRHTLKKSIQNKGRDSMQGNPDSLRRDDITVNDPVNRKDQKKGV